MWVPFGILAGFQLLLRKCWGSWGDGGVSDTLDIWKGTACLGLGT